MWARGPSRQFHPAAEGYPLTNRTEHRIRLGQDSVVTKEEDIYLLENLQVRHSVSRKFDESGLRTTHKHCGNVKKLEHGAKKENEPDPLTDTHVKRGTPGGTNAEMIGSKRCERIPRNDDVVMWRESITYQIEVVHAV